MNEGEHTGGHKGGHRGRKFRSKRLRTSLAKPENRNDAPLPEQKTENRIAKVMARAGVASRREAETLIAAGRVSVNGSVISSPALNVTDKDRIVIDGRPMPEKERTRLFLYHKPPGLVTTNADERGRATIFGGLPDDMPRVMSVGRLDINSEGLLLLTNDGGLARALELPTTGWLRRYRVRAYGSITQDKLDALKDGIEIEGVQYGAIEAKLEREQGSNVWIAFAMREGKNREIRNVLGHLGLKVNRLIRVSYGPFQLGDLADGAVEEVKTRALREQIGDRLAAIAGADFSGPIVERDIPERPTSASTRHPEERASRDDRPERRGRESGRSDFKRDRNDRNRPSFENRDRRPSRDESQRADRRGDERRDDRKARHERGGERPQRHGDKRHGEKRFGDKPEGDRRDPSQRFNTRGRDDKRKTWFRKPQKHDDRNESGGDKRWPDHSASERPQHRAGGDQKPRFSRDDRKPRFNRDEQKPRFERDDRKPFHRGDDRKQHQGGDARKPRFGGDDRKPRHERDDRAPPRDERPRDGSGGGDRPRPPRKGRPYHGKRDR